MKPLISMNSITNEDIFQDQSKQKLVVIIFFRSFVQKTHLQSALQQVFCFDPICHKSSYNSMLQMENQASLQRVRHHSLLHLKNRCKSKRDALIHGQLWTSLLHHLYVGTLPLSSELIRRISPSFLVDNQKCRDHTNEQKPQKLSSYSTHSIKLVPIL